MDNRTAFFIILMLIAGGAFVTSWKVSEDTHPYEFSKIRYVPPMPTNSDNLVTVEGRELGRMLFYDPILSKDSILSCASCHQQAFAFSDGYNQFSTGVNDLLTDRNTPPLFNLAWYEAFFWDGRAPTIETQVFEPVRSHREMDLDWEVAIERLQKSERYPPLFYRAFGTTSIDSILVSKAIAQFERTLISFDSKFDRVLRGEDYLSPAEYKGYELMNDQTKGNCLHCHTTDGNGLGTTGKFSNNGLSNAQKMQDYNDQGKGAITQKIEDMGYFKIPSLRNIALTPPYMHDGRFETLEEVLSFYAKGLQPSYNIDPKMSHVPKGGNGLSKLEQTYIIAFLKTLTDSVFIENPTHGNPFK